MSLGQNPFTQSPTPFLHTAFTMIVDVNHQDYGTQAQRKINYILCNFSVILLYSYEFII